MLGTCAIGSRDPTGNIALGGRGVVAKFHFARGVHHPGRVSGPCFLQGSGRRGREVFLWVRATQGYFARAARGNADEDAEGVWSWRARRHLVCGPVTRRHAIVSFFGPCRAGALGASGAWRGGRICRQGWTLGRHAVTWSGGRTTSLNNPALWPCGQGLYSPPTFPCCCQCYVLPCQDSRHSRPGLPQHSLLGATWRFYRVKDPLMLD